MSHFITTPIFYVNSRPHIGHIFTAVWADVSNRWSRLNNRSTVFSTGTDEHGTKVNSAALRSNVQVGEYCDRISTEFRHLFDTFKVDYTHFVRTTDLSHQRAVQSVWNALESNSLIESGQYSGWYSETDECFYGNKEIELVSGDRAISLTTKSECRFVTERNYMFRIADVAHKVIRWLENEKPIRPGRYCSEMIGFLKRNTKAVSISRQRDRCPWGIAVPNDKEQIIYVWMDALFNFSFGLRFTRNDILINYLTVAGYPDKLNCWPPDVQFVGKDIIRFHSILWPSILFAIGLDPPKQIICHGHFLMEGMKMSKSLGNVVIPSEGLLKFTLDGFRYALIRCGPKEDDSNFYEKSFYELINAELCNTYANLLSRCCSNIVNPEMIMYPCEEGDNALSEMKAITIQKVRSLYDAFDFQNGAVAIMAYDVVLAQNNIFLLNKIVLSKFKTFFLNNIALKIPMGTPKLLYTPLPQRSQFRFMIL